MDCSAHTALAEQARASYVGEGLQINTLVWSQISDLRIGDYT